MPPTSQTTAEVLSVLWPGLTSSSDPPSPPQLLSSSSAHPPPPHLLLSSGPEKTRLTKPKAGKSPERPRITASPSPSPLSGNLRYEAEFSLNSLFMVTILLLLLQGRLTVQAGAGLPPSLRPAPLPPLHSLRLPLSLLQPHLVPGQHLALHWGPHVRARLQLPEQREVGRLPGGLQFQLRLLLH